MTSQDILAIVMIAVGCTGFGLCIGWVFGKVAGHTEAAAQWRDVQANLVRDTTDNAGA